MVDVDLDQIGSGAVKPPAIRHYKLSQAVEAHRLSEACQLQGKLVLEVH